MISSRGSNLITVEDILKLVESDAQIFQLYTPGVAFNSLIPSPLRVDRKPSFIIRRLESHTYWYDYALDQKGNFVSYVHALFPTMTYDDLLAKIHKDLQSSSIEGILPSVVSIKKVELQIKRRKFTEGDLNYWKRFGITEKTLKLFKVHAISHFWLNGVRHTCNEPAYAYEIKGKFKIYRPTKDEYRFLSGTYAIQGLDLLPAKGNILVVQKSYKDVMLMYEYGYPSIAPQSESTPIDPAVAKDLKERFDHIFVLYDDDDAGRKGAEMIANVLGATKLFISGSEAKDATDHCALYGKETTEEFVAELLNNGQ